MGHGNIPNFPWKPQRSYNQWNGDGRWGLSERFFKKSRVPFVLPPLPVAGMQTRYILQPFADLKGESHSPKMPEQQDTGARVTEDTMYWTKIAAFGNDSQILLLSKKTSKYTTCIIGHDENKNNKYQNLDDIAKSIIGGKFIALNMKMKVNGKHFIQKFSWATAKLRQKN